MTPQSETLPFSIPKANGLLCQPTSGAAGCARGAGGETAAVVVWHSQRQGFGWTTAGATTVNGLAGRCRRKEVPSGRKDWHLGSQRGLNQSGFGAATGLENGGRSLGCRWSDTRAGHNSGGRTVCRRFDDTWRRLSRVF